MNTIKIHETAFMTSMFRAMNESLSKDGFSKLWNNSKTKVWVDDYLSEVSSEEVHTHCVRNRFFLDQIKSLYQNKEIETVINFGAGFSMYPFLLDDKLQHIEIDKPDIIQYKKSQIEKWMQLEKLPKRKICFLGVDFSTNYKEELFEKLKSLVQKKSTFILLEGVIFFLNLKETDDLFDFFKSIQSKGDYIGSVSYQNNVKDSIAFEKLLLFFNKKLAKTTKDDYLTLNTNYYKEKEAYKLIMQEDYFSYSKHTKNEVQQNKEEILNESFYLLQKQV